MADVMVLIPTFRRPNSLGRLLDALETLETSADVSVLVADNDAEGRQGHDLCRARQDSFRFPLETICVTERGIAQNRNALVARALADPRMRFVAMLDDDEWPHPGWLEGLLGTQAQFGADLVEGRIECVYENLQTAGTDQHATVAQEPEASGPIAMPQATANLLLTRACLDRIAAPHFDPQFALSGGEDRDFFIRLKQAGASFAWSAEALAYAYVPVTRTGLKWTLARAYGVGNSDMRIFLKHCAGAGALFRELIKIAAAFVIAPPLLLLLAASPRRRLAALRTLWRAAGKFAALIGRRHQEYAVIHGN